MFTGHIMGIPPIGSPHLVVVVLYPIPHNTPHGDYRGISGMGWYYHYAVLLVCGP